MAEGNGHRNGGATIFEVADAVGVSITTVSHVFSGKRPVSEITRRRVLDAAERLQYRARTSARALATGRTMTLALQISMAWNEIVLNPFFTSMLPAMSEAAVELGYSFVMVPPSPPRATFIEPLVHQRGIDGAVVVDPRRGEPFVAELALAGVPYVSLGRVPDAGLEVPRVDHDHRTACRAVLEHLAERRYERPAVLTMGDDISYFADVQAAFGEHIDRPVIARAGDFTDSAAYAETTRILRGRPRPDAVFCVNDHLAVGALRAAADLGVRVPEELGVVGVGDSALATLTSPSLTSVGVYPDLAGRLLMTVMHAVLMGSETPPDWTAVPTRLVARQSTARPPA
jgi:DNA-binding LacI/PurR family transcriptional regulator